MFSIHLTPQKTMNHLMRPPRDKAGAPPPWEALYLVGHHLDAKTLAAASCASKTWLDCLSSDHLWEPLFSTVFGDYHDASVPYRRLYAVFHTAAKRRQRKPPKPTLSLHTLLFMLSINSPMGPAKTVITPCRSLKLDPTGLFRFDVNIDAPWTVDALKGVRVTWHVVVEGWKGVFCMMECGGKAGGKAGSRGGVHGWFSEELPSPGCGCCSNGMASGLVGDLRLGVRFQGGGEKAMVEKVSVGVLSVCSWRYVSIDDALRYLQHFLC